MKQNIVYHASPKQGLKLIIPKESTMQKKFVYAVKEKDLAALFLGRWMGDFSCKIGRDKETGLPYICERFKGAFDKRYDRSASIYWLDGGDFKEDQTMWKEEVVCDHKLTPIKEEKIANAKEYIIKLAKDKKLLLGLYPNKICNILEDNSDLLKQIKKLKKSMSKEKVEDMLKAVKEYYPHLLERI